MSTEITHGDVHEEHHDHGPDKGLMRWVRTTNGALGCLLGNCHR